MACNIVNLYEMTARFSLDMPDVKYTPFTYEWGPLDLPLPSRSVNFWQGIKTIAGHGDPTNKEGLAVHQYVANTSMKHPFTILSSPSCQRCWPFNDRRWPETLDSGSLAIQADVKKKDAPSDEVPPWVSSPNHSERSNSLFQAFHQGVRRLTALA